MSQDDVTQETLERAARGALDVLDLLRAGDSGLNGTARAVLEDAAFAWQRAIILARATLKASEGSDR